MATIYDDLKEAAIEMLTEFGQSRTFTNTVYGEIDHTTGQKTETVTTYTALCYKDTYNTFEKNNTSIEAGDLLLIAEDGTYAIGDTVDIDGHNWRLMDPQPIGDTSVIYYLQVRRG